MLSIQECIGLKETVVIRMYKYQFRQCNQAAMPNEATNSEIRFQIHRAVESLAIKPENENW
ncbi:hypothetical protein DSCOOX_49150 [Desulfosarcina ovata subsp. ovata]|uniref:Uncharacterized protein n=1 Tax=Desulfosarcina ovata subsp. ovata TaxID=2752305 RepID=A0A5K8AGC0_9BACT|nr:hypothetical protein DSCOOX_49150 [Desulfosarcina ovata subsp. ovata]